MYVEKRSPTCTGRTHRRGPVQVRGATSKGVHPSTQSEHLEQGRYRHVDTGTPTCTGRTHQTGPVYTRGYTSKGVHSRAQGEHTEKGRYRHVDPYPNAHSLVYRSNIPKSGGKGSWIHVPRRTATCPGRPHRKEPVEARGSTSRGVHPSAQDEHP